MAILDNTICRIRVYYLNSGNKLYILVNNSSDNDLRGLQLRLFRTNQWTIRIVPDLTSFQWHVFRKHRLRSAVYSESRKPETNKTKENRLYN